MGMLTLICAGGRHVPHEGPAGVADAALPCVARDRRERHPEKGLEGGVAAFGAGAVFGADAVWRGRRMAQARRWGSFGWLLALAA